jgi:hypothetical protein
MMGVLLGKLRSAHPLLVAVGIGALVTLVSRVLPASWSATAVGGVFFAATALLALGRGQRAADAGLALGGLLDPAPLALRRLLPDAVDALLATVATLLLLVPGTALGYVLWNRPAASLDGARALAVGAGDPSGLALLDLALGHLLVVALPEEAFYRGYLQSGLDARWDRRVRVLGVEVGASLVVTSALFALGHFATLPNPARLAVFFPSLLFGWLRARTGGIGAPVLVHAAANVLVAALAAGYAR